MLSTENIAFTLPKVLFKTVLQFGISLTFVIIIDLITWKESFKLALTSIKKILFILYFIASPDSVQIFFLDCKQLLIYSFERKVKVCLLKIDYK